MKIFVLPLVAFATLHLASAGVVITEEADQIDGQAPGRTMLTITASGDRARVDIGKDISSIVDSKSGAVISLIHAQKMAMQLPDGAIDAIRQKTAQTKAKPDLKPSGKKEVINGFDCEEYTGTMQGMDVSFWVTQEVKNQQEILDQIGKLSGAANPFKAALQSGADFPGFPIRTTVKSPQMGSSTMTVTSIKNEDVPASTFTIPADYKTLDLPKMAPPGGGAPAVPVDSKGN